MHRKVDEWQAALPLVMQAALTPSLLSALDTASPADSGAAHTHCQTALDQAYSALEAVFLRVFE